MQRWPHEIKSYTQSEVNIYCVLNETWQQFRLTLKGLPTETKLDKLFIWREQGLLHCPSQEAFRVYEVQIDNYLNALKRGAQLTMDLRVQR